MILPTVVIIVIIAMNCSQPASMMDQKIVKIGSGHEPKKEVLIVYF